MTSFKFQLLVSCLPNHAMIEMRMNRPYKSCLYRV